MTLLESESPLPPEKLYELRDFEERQLDYITSKIVDAITERVGKEKLERAIKDLKAGKLTIRQASKKLGIKTGDLIMVLEKRKVFPKTELEKRLGELLKG